MGLPATHKLHKWPAAGWPGLACVAGLPCWRRWHRCMRVLPGGAGGSVEGRGLKHGAPLPAAHSTLCVRRQKSKDIEVDLWRFEVPAQTDS